MLGTVESLAHLVHPRSRLRLGLALLADCVGGRLPEVAGMISNLAPGETNRVSLDGDAIYLLIQCYQPKRRAEGRFEAHARHTDLQFLWSGCECIEVCDLRALGSSPQYDRNGNVYFPLNDKVHSRLILQAGDVAVLSPGDAHAACLRIEAETSELVRKMVVKVMDAHLPVGSEEAASLRAATKREAARLDAMLVSASLKDHPGGMR